MHNNVRGLGTSIEHIVMIIKDQRGNDLLYSLQIFSRLFMKLTTGTSVIGGDMLRIKLDFIFVRLVSLISDISLKLNEGLDNF